MATMPSSEQILAGLGAIANAWKPVSILWHGYFAVLVLGLLFGVRPPRRIAGVLLCLPLLSVSALAWLSANPFNGTVFFLAGLILLLIAARHSGEAVIVAPASITFPGILFIVFGWAYPHFLPGGSTMEYLYAAPAGLIPCPTLSLAIGFTLVLGGLGSRSWCLVLVLMSLLYGTIGVAWLGVVIDGVLLLGALFLAYVLFSPQLPDSRRGDAAR